MPDADSRPLTGTGAYKLEGMEVPVSDDEDEYEDDFEVGLLERFRTMKQLWISRWRRKMRKS